MSCDAREWLNADEQQAVARLAKALGTGAPGTAGARARPVRGSGGGLLGLEPWRQGEELRHLDWPARLRTGALWVRRLQAEGEERAVLFVDTSGSMTGPKRVAAGRLAAGLELLWAVRRLPSLTLRLAGELPDALRRARVQLRPADRVVVLSDFAHHAPMAEIVGALPRARGRGVDVVMLCDPQADEQLAETARELVDVEGPRARQVHVDALSRARFAAAVRDFAAVLEREVTACGCVFHGVRVPLAGALLPTLERVALRQRS